MPYHNTLFPMTENNNPVVQEPQDAPTEGRARTRKKAEVKVGTSFHEKLISLQTSLCVPKTNVNQLHNFKYRSLEGIFESIKPALAENGLTLLFEDDVRLIGNRLVYCTKAILSDSRDQVSATGFAIIPERDTYSSSIQLTGASATYAKKYALCSLLILDDARVDITDDADYSRIDKMQARETPQENVQPEAAAQEAEPEAAADNSAPVPADDDAPANSVRSIINSLVEKYFNKDKETMTSDNIRWNQYVTATAQFKFKNEQPSFENFVKKVTAKVNLSTDSLLQMISEAGRDDLLASLMS